MAEFMGKTISNRLIASSCISTENMSNIRRLYNNGIRGVILKSCADYTREGVSGKRRFAIGDKGYVYASSTFDREILTLDECLDLMGGLRDLNDLLVIPSFTAYGLSPDEWIPSCKKMEEANADGIQLDFFYMGNIIGTDHFSERIINLLRELKNSIRIPIMPKLNINLPKDYIIPLLVDAGIEYVSLLDSVRSPLLEKNENEYLISNRLDPGSTSCFGGWQLPITLGYTYTAALHGLKVCAGGGVTCSEDVKKLFAVGALTVQSATYLTQNPYGVEELMAV